MVYDHSSGASQAGEIAPIAWSDEVLTYAATLVPPEKTYLGVPFYGYDWTGSTGQPLDWIKATKIARQQGVEVKRSASNEATFTYNDGKNTVYFNDALTMKTRLEMLLAEHPHVAGIAIWRLGNEDPANWTEVRNAFGVKQ
jgi:spore germination protein YaaH